MESAIDPSGFTAPSPWSMFLSDDSPIAVITAICCARTGSSIFVAAFITWPALRNCSIPYPATLASGGIDATFNSPTPAHAPPPPIDATSMIDNTNGNSPANTPASTFISYPVTPKHPQRPQTVRRP
ncbi:hypothetical protein ABMA10_03805 [Plantibacter sp. RU18]